MRTYVAFVDPSGGSSDSFALAVAHLSIFGKSVLDGFWERKPPFSPAEVTGEFADIVKSYRIDAVVGDAYSGEWVREAFRENGVEYLLSEKTKSEIFLTALALVNSGRVKMPRDRRLAAQFLSLERKPSRSGKDSVDHPPAGHDDVANAVAGALVLTRAEMAEHDLVACADVAPRPGFGPPKPIKGNDLAPDDPGPERFWKTL
jgi:hypothetical protein